MVLEFFWLLDSPGLATTAPVVVRDWDDVYMRCQKRAEGGPKEEGGAKSEEGAVGWGM